MKKWAIASTMIIILILYGSIVYMSSSDISEVTTNDAGYFGEPQNGKRDIAQSKLELFLQEHNANEQVAQAYRFALENPQDILSSVKCYCGCLQQDHNNNHDCFINDDGSFDLMGLNCGLCVKTALTSKQMLAQGKTITAIAEYIDLQWGNKN